MPLFVCSQCETVENTALSDFWGRRIGSKPPLCSECGDAGKWHGCFQKRKADATGFVNPAGHFVFAKEKETGQFDHLGPWSPYQPRGDE